MEPFQMTTGAVTAAGSELGSLAAAVAGAAFLIRSIKQPLAQAVDAATRIDAPA